MHTPSEFVANEVVEAFGVDPARVRAVHHGIPVLPDAGSGPGPASPSFPVELPRGTSRYVLAIGTVEPRKDYPMLVSAFNALAAVHPDVALVVVGSDGWGADQFRVAVASSAARSRVVRTGYLGDGDLAVVLRHAAVLAYPSVYEGFGFPPVQAMSCGVPVVATAVGAVPEVVGDGALLVDGGDGEGLAAALDRVLAGGPGVEALVERGRRRSRAFTWSACADGLAALYRDVDGDMGGRVRAASSGSRS